jgi:hypothetical protein
MMSFGLAIRVYGEWIMRCVVEFCKVSKSPLRIIVSFKKKKQVLCCMTTANKQNKDLVAQAWRCSGVVD